MQETTMFCNWFSGRRTSTPKASPARTTTRLGLETMENREVPCASGQEVLFPTETIMPGTRDGAAEVRPTESVAPSDPGTETVRITGGTPETGAEAGIVVNWYEGVPLSEPAPPRG